MSKRDDAEIILYARLVTVVLSGILLSILVAASVVALFVEGVEPSELVGVLAIIVPALVTLWGFALGIGRILGGR